MKSCDVALVVSCNVSINGNFNVELAYSSYVSSTAFDNIAVSSSSVAGVDFKAADVVV